MKLPLGLLCAIVLIIMQNNAPGALAMEGDSDSGLIYERFASPTDPPSARAGFHNQIVRATRHFHHQCHECCVVIGIMVAFLLIVIAFFASPLFVALVLEFFSEILQ